MRIQSLLALLLTIVLVAVMSAGIQNLPASPFSAPQFAVSTQIVPGNPNCAQYCLLGVKDDSPGDGSFGNASITVTTDLSADGRYIDWSANIGVDKVIIKAGDSARVYTYDPEALSGTGLHGEINANNGQPFEVSHIEVCYDLNDPTNTPTHTATHTPVPPSNTPSNTPVPPSSTPTNTPSNTPVPPSSTSTNTPTNTPVPPSATRTDTPTNTAVIPSATSTNTPTHTPVPPTATNSATPTNTTAPDPGEPSATATDTPTNTPVPPSATSTDTPTNTPVPPSATSTDTPTNTPVPPSATSTDTPTNTPVPPSSTPTEDDPGPQDPTNTATNPPPSEPSNTPTNQPPADPSNTPSDPPGDPSATPQNPTATNQPPSDPSETPGTDPAPQEPTATNTAPSNPPAGGPTDTSVPPTVIPPTVVLPTEPPSTPTATVAPICATLNLPTLGISAAPGQALPGTEVAYTLVLNNPHNAAVADVNLTASLSALAEYLGASANQGQPAYQAGSNSVVLAVGTLAPGQTVQMTINVRLAANAPASSRVNVSASATVAGNPCLQAGAGVTITPAGIPVTGVGPGWEELRVMLFGGLTLIGALVWVGRTAGRRLFARR